MWSAFGSLFGRKPAIKEINVHFNKKKLRVTFSPEDYDNQKQVPLSGFRSKLANALQVPPRELVLYQLDPQRKLSNLKATLEDYGLQDGSDVLAVHVKAEAAQQQQQQKQAPAAKPKLTVTQRIDEVVASVDTELGARIAKLVKEGPPADPEQRETENRVLSEIVLAKTIALDDVEVSTPEERQHRKNAIAKMQKYHKDIDAAMARPPRQEPVADAAAGDAAAGDAAAPQRSEESGSGSSAAAGSVAAAGAAKPRKKKAQNKKKGKR